MASGIWPSVSGAVAQSQVVDVVANNLANADTSAFKKDQTTFKEYLSVLERNPNHTDIPRGPIKNRELYPLDGRDQSFVVVDGTHTDFRQGPLTPTHGALDLALEGPGFFEVLTPAGIRYTRQGGFKLDGNGRLVNGAGHPVLASPAQGVPGAPALAAATPLARTINLADRTHLSISEDGDIFAGEDLVARVSVAGFGDEKKLLKDGHDLFRSADTVANPALARPLQTKVRQGFLERSNVNPVEEMVNLIKANRLFEHDLKAMKVYDEMMAKESNDVGKL